MEVFNPVFNEFIVGISRVQSTADLEHIKSQLKVAEEKKDLSSVEVAQLTVVAAIAFSAIHWRDVSRKQTEALAKLHQTKNHTNTNIEVSSKIEKRKN